jgi:hypothetical protein
MVKLLSAYLFRVRNRARIAEHHVRSWLVEPLRDHPPALTRATAEVVEARMMKKVSKVNDIGTVACWAVRSG